MKFRRAAGAVCAIAMLGAASSTAFAAAEADLLVAYDQTHSASVGGQDNANVLAANAVAGCNAVYDRSGAGARIRIVGYHQAAQYLYQTTSKGGFVNWMANYDSHMTDVVDAGNARGADLVAWLCVSTSDGAAAVAQQPGRYSAFDPGQFWTAVVAHELGGHNYGCDHRGGRAVPGQKTIMMHNYCDGGGSTPPYIFSNPNIWLNGAKLIGETSCLGATVNGGDNAYLISTTCQGVADRYGRVVVAPNLNNVVLRWCFTNAAGSAVTDTTITDLVSGSNAVVRGVGATFTGKALRIPGGTTGNTAANSIAAYIDLPNGIISSRTNLTIEIWATPLSAPNWARLLDFGRTAEAGNGAPGEWTGLPGTPAPGSTSSSDNIMLSACIGTDINQQRFEAKLNGTAVTLDAGLATTAGVPHHYAITFSDGVGDYGAAGGRWQWFRDGDAVAYLDVNYKLASLEDVNNWLGRSLWSGDNMANNEYQEVRISSVALTRDEILANYSLGPNRFVATVTMTADDPLGSASFAAAGNWSDGLAPSAGKTYETYRFRLRTPADAASRSFAGQALTVSGGGITWKGTSSSTLTVGNLTLTGNPELVQAGSGTWTLAGNLAVKSDEAMLRAANGPINLSASLSGSGNLLCVNNTVTFSGNNSAFTGKTIVGDGRFSGLSIDAETRLGANPTTFTADQLTLNRGILYSGNLTIDDANRGLRIGVSAGLFNVTPGTTTTIAVPLSSPASGATVVTTPLYPNPVSGLFIKENSGALVLTHPNNSHAGEININGGSLVVSGGGRLNNGDQAMPVVNNASFIIGSTAAQTISGAISGAGAFVKSNTGTLTLTGANPMSGAVTINGGTLFANPANAANNRAFSYVSGITINSGGTLRSGPNGLFGSDGTQEKPITVNAGGTLTANGSLSSDVGVGTVTLAGGTLATLAAGATDYGSWRFDEAGDKLVVTQSSTVSAFNVKFGHPSAHINVAAGRTLNFTGTIRNASSGGISYLTVSNGTGTVILTGANIYSGATLVASGTLLVNGSINNSPVTVAPGGTLGGNGVIGSAITVQSGGTFAPGTSIGKLTVNSSLTLEAGSATIIELSKDSGVTTNDAVTVLTSVNYGGALVVTNVGATALAAGDSFKLFTAGAYNNSFATVTLPPLANGLVWTNRLAVDGSVAVISPVSTVPTNIVWSVSNGGLTLSWPENQIGWRLLEQTNNLAAGVSSDPNDWSEVVGSSTTNQVNLPLDVAKPAVFYRLSYP
jgi:autotransporter-associated beta strand protein